MNSRSLNAVLSFCFALLPITGLSHIGESDVLCLKSIKESLKDPPDILESTWNFSNKTEGFICSFTGIECWKRSENRVLNIRLSNMGLKGTFPLGLNLCSDLQVLDLSSNNLNGVIPPNISAIIPFVVTLDISSNSFSGQIPDTLANCTFLNVLELDHNRLSGQIPRELGQLGRLTKFSVANNLLVGSIPYFSEAVITPDNFANNPGLCGYPLSPCQASSWKSKTGVITAAAVAGAWCHWRLLSYMLLLSPRQAALISF